MQKPDLVAAEKDIYEDFSESITENIKTYGQLFLGQPQYFSIFWSTIFRRVLRRKMKPNFGSVRNNN